MKIRKQVRTEGMIERVVRALVLPPHSVTLTPLEAAVLVDELETDGRTTALKLPDANDVEQYGKSSTVPPWKKQG